MSHIISKFMESVYNFTLSFCLRRSLLYASIDYAYHFEEQLLYVSVAEREAVDSLRCKVITYKIALNPFTVQTSETMFTPASYTVDSSITKCCYDEYGKTVVTFVTDVSSTLRYFRWKVFGGNVNTFGTSPSNSNIWDVEPLGASASLLLAHVTSEKIGLRRLNKSATPNYYSSVTVVVLD